MITAKLAAEQGREIFVLPPADIFSSRYSGNIKLIREDALGNREIITLNLNNAEIVTCPYYYLQQNDILYVNPNKTKAKNSDIGQSTSLWFSATSILVSVASLLFNILK